MSILTVRQLTDALRDTVEASFPFVWVRGEVSNLSRPGSGHVYFSLKDSDSLLNCVWFKGQQRGPERFDPLTGEVFENGPRPCLAQNMQNGQQVLCAGRITVYAPRGSYQLVVELGQEAGKGELHAAFEALKNALAARGFFAQERKRPLPHNPQRVAVITAPTGAVIHDFLRIAGTRGCGADIRVYPVPVQGAAAAPAIAAALRAANTEQWAEVIVLIRGGGSLEDLWAFNEEAVAEAVFQSGIPVLAGIGHEVDVSMADMTADVRAATPTHAAQLLWPSREDMMQQVDAWEDALCNAVKLHMERREQMLARKEQALSWLSPARALARREEQFENRLQRLLRCGATLVQGRAEKLARLSEMLLMVGNRLHGRRQDALQNMCVLLESLSPLAPLERGYALVRKSGRDILLRSVRDAAAGDDVYIQLHDGGMDARIVRTEEG